MAAVAGALGAAYALRNFHRATMRDLLLCLATAGACGVLLMILAAVIGGSGYHTLAHRLAVGVASLLLYVPVTFPLAEVTFRGAFDAHVHHPGESHEYLSAFLVSSLLGVHCAIGVPLSLCGKRSGNLFVTGAAHALVDAVRNAIVVLPHL